MREGRQCLIVTSSTMVCHSEVVVKELASKPAVPQPAQGGTTTVKLDPGKKDGEIRLRLPAGVNGTRWNLYDQGSGKPVGQDGFIGVNSPQSCPAGTYMLQFHDYFMTGIEV